MGVVRKISIALTEELAAEVDRAVDSGDYASGSEVIREALRAWRRQRAEHEADIAYVRAKWEEGLASGDPLEGNFDVDDITRRGMARLAEMRRG